jgi:YfiH family protein
LNQIPNSPLSPSTWHWQAWKDLPYLTCSLLEPWPHGFFTQMFWPRMPSELIEVLQPEAEVYRVKQVHGNTVLTTSEIAAAAGQGDDLPLADGSLTEKADRSVWACSADCTPALIADERTGQVAAVHAGWRGTATKILPVAIARLVASGSQIEHLRVALGPAIAGEVYQVSLQVAAEVGATILPVEAASSPEDIAAALAQLPDPPILPDPHPGRVRLDVRRVNAIQLQQLGISADRIAIAPHCTYQEPERFFSYRRDKLKKVQWSGIVSRSSN